MLLNLPIPAYLIFVGASSVLLGRATQPLTLIPAAVLFICLFYGKKRNALTLPLLTFALAWFHFYSHLNWCFALYLAIPAKDFYEDKKARKYIVFSFVNVLIYSAIRLSYMPHTTYNWLVTIQDLLSTLMVTVIAHKFVLSQREKEYLKEEKNRLREVDTLTGLLNGQSFYMRLNRLIRTNRPFVLIVIDCTDMKVINNEHGFDEGNRLIVSMAQRLEAAFSDAHMISRYAGDKFAVVTHQFNPSFSIATTRDIEAFLDAFSSESSDSSFCYGYSQFPRDGVDHDALIAISEERLFHMKQSKLDKKSEELFRSEKLKVIGELAAGMAHEIRNPLTTVRGYLQFSKEYDYTIEPWYEFIMAEIGRVVSLTEEFLSFSKPQAVKYLATPLHDCVLRAVHLVESDALRTGHRLTFDYSERAEDLLCLLDRDKIVQVILNLIRNAFEAMSPPGTVTIYLCRDSSDGVLEVTDTGPGIPPEHLARIFDPFYTTKDSGTGLGLYICHKIIQDHQGTISVQSDAGKGTTFRITLPLTQS